MLSAELIPLIDVTFSTPTGFCNNYHCSQQAARLAAAAVVNRYLVHVGISFRLNRKDKSVMANSVNAAISR
jgi:hypothetical protein